MRSALGYKTDYALPYPLINTQPQWCFNSINRICRKLTLLKNNKIRKSYIALGLTLILMIGCSINQPAVSIETKYTTEVKEYGTYIGFNLQHELYNTGVEPNPKRFPAYKF